MFLSDKIPLLYHNFIPELLRVKYPSEEIATCENCNLCRSIQSPYFNAKCCAYFPHLSNFLIGGILSDNDESLALGKDRIKKQIKAQIGITPYGIIPSVQYSHQKKALKSMDFWARPKELLESQLCPYYDKGNCTVWKYRENLCVTHFCSSIGGAAGKTFWDKVKRFVKMAETKLSQYAMLQLGWSPSKIKTEAVTTSDFNLEDEQGNIIESNYKSLWGDWAGREEEFYIKCFEIVSEANAETFKQITGLEREILEAAIIDSQKDFIKNILPEKLLLNPKVVTERDEDGFTRLLFGDVSAKIPSVIAPLIRGFNGERTTVEVFHLGYNILYNMSEIVDELYAKEILIKS